jgi:hypothetical protein
LAEIHVHEASPPDLALAARVENLEKVLDQVVAVLNQQNGAVAELSRRIDRLQAQVDSEPTPTPTPDPEPIPEPEKESVKR